MNSILILITFIVVAIWTFYYSYSWKQRLKLWLTPKGFFQGLMQALIFIQFLLPPLLPFPHTLFDSSLGVLGLVLYIGGAILAVWAKLIMKKSWGMPAQHDIKRQDQLVTWGPFGYTRNPIYVGLLLMLIGFELTRGSFLIILVIPAFLYFHRSILMEERLLKQHFGKDYLDYKEKVPRYI